MEMAFHVCNSQTTASHLFFYFFKAYSLSLTVQCAAMKKSQSGGTLENEDISMSACSYWLGCFVFQATEQFWFVFYIKDEIFNECRERESVCESVSERV